MGIQTWISKRKERRAEKRMEETGSTQIGEAPQSFSDFTPVTDTSGRYTGGGGGVSGGRTSTTTTPTTTTTYQDIILPSPTVIPSRDITTQQSLREIYDPASQVYRQSLYGVGGTQYERIPTREEQRKIDIAQEKGELGYQLTGVSGKEFKELEDIQIKIKSSSSKLEDLSKDLENKYKNLVEEDKFIGTEEQYKQYTKDFNKYNIERIKLEGNIARYERVGGTISKEGIIEMPKVTVGGVIGTYKGKKVDLYKFSGLYSSSLGVQASAGVGFFARTGGQVIGETLGKALGKRKYVLAEARDIPEKTLKGIYQPQFGTATEFDPLTGRAKAKFEDVTIKARTRPELYFTGEQLGEATGTILGGVGEGAKYLVPVAGGVFFASEVAEEVKKVGGAKQYIKEKPLEAVLLGSVVLGAGTIKGVQALKVAKARKVSQQLLRLSESPIRYLEVIDKGKRQVKLRGLQEYKGLRREIKVEGKLRKTEKGFELIPEARGYAITTGEVKGLIGKKQYFGFDVFATGTKGTAIPYRTIGDIRWYKTLGVSTYEPVGSTYALFKKGARFKDIEKQLQKQVRLRGDVTKEIYTGDTFGLKENLFLGVKKDKEIGLTFVKKAKEVKDVKIIRTTKGKGTPFAQTFAEEYAPQIIKPEIIEKGLAKQIIKPPKPTPPPIIIVQEGLPSMVGGTGLKTIPKPSYATLGVYEEQILLPDTKLKGVIQPSFVEVKTRQEYIQPQIEMLKTRQRFIQPLKEEVKTRLDIKSAQEFIQPIKEDVRVSQLFRQALEIKQVQKERLAQIQRARQAQRPIEQLKFKPFGLGDAMTRIKKIAKEKPEVFEVFGRRFGEEIKLGIFKTKPKAEKKLEKFLVKTLGAAGFIEKEGKKLKAIEIELLKKKGFRPSKISEFLVVEKKEKRLRRKTTGKDIQYFRSKPLKGRRKGKSLFGI